MTIKEAIETVNINMPTENYTMLREALKTLIDYVSNSIVYPEKKEYAESQLYAHYWEQGYNQCWEDFHKLNKKA